MATSIAIEEESGTGNGRVPEHNGYYAGNFSTRRLADEGSGPVARQRIGIWRLPAGTLIDAV
jgi:hypothetical protein